MMAASAQRLIAAGLPMEEFPQSLPNLTAASQNLYELIQSGGLVVYPDPGMRLAISRWLTSQPQCFGMAAANRTETVQ